MTFQTISNSFTTRLIRVVVLFIVVCMYVCISDSYPGVPSLQIAVCSPRDPCITLSFIRHQNKLYYIGVHRNHFRCSVEWRGHQNNFLRTYRAMRGHKNHLQRPCWIVERRQTNKKTPGLGKTTFNAIRTRSQKHYDLVTKFWMASGDSRIANFSIK